MKDIFGTLDLGIGTYRFSVGKLVPEMTKAAWQSKRSDIEKLSPGITRSKFIYSLPRRKYEQEWDKEYRGPGPFARFLALVFRLIPRFGPFKVMAFRPIPQSSEQDFLRSFEATVGQYRQRLEDVRRGRLSLQTAHRRKLAAAPRQAGRIPAGTLGPFAAANHRSRA